MSIKSRNDNTIQLQDARGNFAVIRRNYKGEPFEWLLTAYGPSKDTSAAKSVDTGGDPEAAGNGGTPARKRSLDNRPESP